jgi:hypothetical protein
LGHFQKPFCPLAFFYTPGLVHTLLQSNNDRVAYIESFSSLTCRTYHPLPFQSLAISLHLTVFNVPFFLLEYICLIHKHIFFLGTCNFLSINQLKNDETSSPVPLQNSSLAEVSNRESLKFHLHCTCRYRFETSAKLEFCKGTGELVSSFFS